MSSVYEAVDERMGRRVAVKVLAVPSCFTASSDLAYMARTQREARAIARLAHPNIVTIHDTGDQGRDHYIVMEYLDGITVRQWLDTNGPLPPSDVATILDQVADGLDAIHAAGIVHR